MERAAARWQQRSWSAAVTPSAVRNRTMCSPSSVRASGSSVTSSVHAATYHALRKNTLCSRLSLEEGDNGYCGHKALDHRARIWFLTPLIDNVSNDAPPLLAYVGTIPSFR